MYQVRYLKRQNVWHKQVCIMYSIFNLAYYIYYYRWCAYKNSLNNFKTFKKCFCLVKYIILFTLWSVMLGSELIFFPHAQNVLCVIYIEMGKQTDKNPPSWELVFEEHILKCVVKLKKLYFLQRKNYPLPTNMWALCRRRQFFV